MNTPRDLNCISCVLHNRLIKPHAGGSLCNRPVYCGRNESFSPLSRRSSTLKPRRNQPCGIHSHAILSAPQSNTKPVNVDSDRATKRGEPVIITSKSDYGLRAALYLAAQGSRVRLREISSTQHIPESVCAHIMRKLVAAEIVNSVAGPAGGYTLAREPESISVASVLTAADRDICIFRCVEDGCDCDLDGKCAFQMILKDFGRSFAEHLEQLSLADLHNKKVALPEFTVGAAPVSVGQGKAS